MPTASGSGIWPGLAGNCDYQDLGGDWFARRTDTDTDTDKRRDHLIHQLHDLGYGVTSLAP